MSDGNRVCYTRRRELHAAVVIVCFYLMLVLGGVTRVGNQWATFGYWAGASIMLIAYAVQGYRSRPAPQRREKLTLPGTAPPGVES